MDQSGFREMALVLRFLGLFLLISCTSGEIEETGGETEGETEGGRP